MDFQNSVADDVLKKMTAGTVLDVGTGPGHLLIKIARGNPSLEVIGLDVSRDMVKIAKANARAASEGMRLLVGDVAEIGMKTESVDLVVATLSFHHWPSPGRAFEEFFRVLKTGGEVWIFEVNRDMTPQSEEWMKKKYKLFTRKAVGLGIKILCRHTITVVNAEEILRNQKSRFDQYKIDQIEPMLIKITLTKK